MRRMLYLIPATLVASGLVLMFSAHVLNYRRPWPVTDFHEWPMFALGCGFRLAAIAATLVCNAIVRQWNGGAT